MDALDEPNAQSFIVKVWVEDSAGGNGRGVWHGHITHVPSHQRRYLKDLDEIEDFVAPYLEEMGVRMSIYWQIKCWLKRLLTKK